MPLSQLIEEHVTSVFMNTEHFASTVLRYIDGDSSNIAQIVAVVNVTNSTFEDQRGRGYAHRAEMFLASSITLNPSDAIKYGDNRYEIEAIGDEEHGMRVVKLIRYQPETRGAKPIRTGGL
jgi:hypothetical protein